MFCYNFHKKYFSIKKAVIFFCRKVHWEFSFGWNNKFVQQLWLPSLISHQNLFSFCISLCFHVDVIQSCHQALSDDENRCGLDLTNLYFFYLDNKFGIETQPFFNFSKRPKWFFFNYLYRFFRTALFEQWRTAITWGHLSD